MMPAKFDQRTVKIEATPKPGQTNTYLFSATASDVKFQGYMKISSEEARPKKEGEGDEETPLPPLAQGEALNCVEWLADRKETQPPPRYSEASLIKALESNGVGRPSTYASIIATLHQRNYVVLDKRSLVPSDLGMKVSALLVATLNELFNVNFTASMEKSLDEIEEGKVEWTHMLKDFYVQFDGWMSKIKMPAADRQAVDKLLACLEVVKEWGPETKRGKRTYSDKKFVESIRKQLADAEKEISPRQLDAMARIAIRYKEQIPDMATVLTEAGCTQILNEPEPQPLTPATYRKLELLKAVPLNESSRKFVDSLASRVESGRRLTPPQISALNNVVDSNSDKIPDFETMRAELELNAVPTTEDEESRTLINALANVTEWKPPVKRGKMVFDDHAFYTSLCQHFQRKKFLSVRQKAALKKMTGRYNRPSAAPGVEAGATETAKKED
jgi:DNA topoisomerase-1